MDSHTTGKPRELALIGNALHENLERIRDAESNPLKANRVRRAVLARAAETVNNYVEGEMKPFLAFLSDHQRFNRLKHLISSNVLRAADVRRMRRILRGEYREVFGSAFPDPFTELYRVGLLGHLAREDTDTVQRFVYPGDQWNASSHLPSSPYYFVHPALSAEIRRHNIHYSVVRGLPIVDGSVWGAFAESHIDRCTVRGLILHVAYDAEFADRLENEVYETFGMEGMLLDLIQERWNLRGGEWRAPTLADAIRTSDVLMILISKRALKSGWVECVSTPWLNGHAEPDEAAREHRTAIAKVLTVLRPSVGARELPAFLREIRARTTQGSSREDHADMVSLLCEDIRSIVESEIVVGEREMDW